MVGLYQNGAILQNEEEIMDVLILIGILLGGKVRKLLGMATIMPTLYITEMDEKQNK